MEEVQKRIAVGRWGGRFRLILGSLARPRFLISHYEPFERIPLFFEVLEQPKAGGGGGEEADLVRGGVSKGELNCVVEVLGLMWLGES